MNPFNLMAVDPFSTGEQLCLLEIPKVADVVAQKSERRKEMVGSAVRTPGFKRFRKAPLKLTVKASILTLQAKMSMQPAFPWVKGQ
jgi:hypothetical protein